MAIQAAQLIARVEVQGSEEAKQKLTGVSEKVKETSGGFKDMLGNALSFAGGQAVFNLVGTSVGFLKDQLSGVFQESMDAQAGMALTTAVLKSTHDASGETAQGIADLAGNLSHLTKFSDDTTQAAENMLLTFTNIGKDVFPRATKTVLDMSQALGQDTKSSAIQLGKALNDPITGVTALQRVGVTFNQTQKDLIATYIKHGQTAQAQGVILKELQKEFGGAAEAAGKTFGGQLAIAGQYVDDFKQNLGDDLMPIVTNFLQEVDQNGMPILQNFSDWFTNDGLPGLENFAGSIEKTVDKSGAFQSVLKTINDVLPDVRFFLGNLADKLTNDLLPPVLSLVKNFSDWIDSSGLLKDAIGFLNFSVDTLSGILGPLVQDTANLFGWLSKNQPATDALKDAVIVLGGAFVALKIADTVSGFQQMFSKISEGEGLVSGLGKAFKEKLSGAVSDFLQNHAPNLKTALDDIKSKSSGAGAEVEAMGAKTAVTSGEVTKLGAAAEVTSVEETTMGADATAAGGEISAMGVDAEVAAAETAPALSGIAGGFASIAGLTALIPLNIMGFQNAMDNAWKDLQGQNWSAFFANFSPFNLGGTAGTDISLFQHLNHDAPPEFEHHPGGRGYASGTDFAPGGWAMVGEQGPELAYIPRGAQVYPHEQSMQMTQGNAGSGSNQPIYLQVDGMTFARLILPHITNVKRLALGVRM